MSDLSPRERLALLRTLNELPPPIFEELLFAIAAPKSLLPGDSAAQGSRGASLCSWSESPVGCGLNTIQETLEEILSHHQGKVAFSTSQQPTVEKPAPSSNQPFQERLPNDVLLDMVYVPGGRFYMGSPEDEKGRRDSEEPQHRVKVPPFFMGKYPVTQAQWYAVSLLDDVEIALSPSPSKLKGGDRPVERISWHEAVEFCSRLSKHTGNQYRLPSESEWEYACRARTTTAYYFGNSITKEQANFIFTVQATTPVGKYPPNHFGLYDMHGNVFEWCQDIWHNNYEDAPSDGSTWVTGRNDDCRMIRGGSWVSDPEYCRSAYRFNYIPDDRDFDIGFRVVCSAPRAL
ncbi:MAG: formylglycine-generating enzyme family protein [Cyanobacteria bacterium P01_E01_bin.6]